MKWSASIGLTLIMDESGMRQSGPYLALYNEGSVITRLRMTVYGEDPRSDNAPGKSEPAEAAAPWLANQLDTLIPNFGNDMVRIQQAGEFIVGSTSNMGKPLSSNFDEAARLVARHGWSYQQHSMFPPETNEYLAVWEEINQEIPIADLRWQLSHLFHDGVEVFDRLAAMGAGAALETQAYSIPRFNGPKFRTALDHMKKGGVRVSAGTDGGNLGPINPWTAIYFMTTGLTADGVTRGLPDNEEISRREALFLYTLGSAWFSFDEEKLGSLEVGKLADLVVLSADFDTVSDEDLRRMKSVLTIVDGRIVHNDGSLILAD